MHGLDVPAVVPDPLHPLDGDELKQEEAGGRHKACNVGLVVSEEGFQFHKFLVLFFNST